MTVEQSFTTQSKFKQLLDAFSIIHFVRAVIIGLAVTYTTKQVTNFSHEADIRRNGEKIECLEAGSKDLVSKELFDERSRTISEEQRGQSDKLDRILEKIK